MGKSDLYAQLGLNPHIVQSRNQDEVELWNVQSGVRFSVHTNLMNIIELFERCASIGVVAASMGVSPEQLEPTIVQLLERRILVSCDQHKHDEHDRGLLNLPRVSFLEYAKASTPADAVLVGVPVDLGGLTSPGARFGPDMLRRNAWEFDWDIDPDTLEVSGVYDLDWGRNLFDRFRLWDLNNLAEPAQLAVLGRIQSLKSVSQIVKYTMGRGTFPVLVGGDHSITAGALDGCQNCPQLGVIHIDAHTDYPGPHGEIACLEDVFHSNYVSYVRQLPNVKFVCQFGLRVPNGPQRQHPSVMQYSSKQVINGDVYKVIEHLPKDISYYVTVDMDVLDPLYMPNTGCFVPGGLTDKQLDDLLVTIGQTLPVIGADFVEITSEPIHDQRVGVMVSQLIARFLSSVMHNRR